MRPLIQLVKAPFESVELIVLFAFDEQGRFADQIIRENKGGALNDIVVDAMISHRFQTVDLETDDPETFKAFIAISGVNVSIVSVANVASLYNALTPANPHFEILQEFYPPKVSEEKEIEKRSSLWQRLLKFKLKRRNNK